MHRLRGTPITQGGDPVEGVPVVVLDTDPGDPWNWTVAGGAWTDADGTWEVTGLEGDPERYHAVTQVDLDGDRYAAESRPFLTAEGVLQSDATTLDFEVLEPTIGPAIPDSGIEQIGFSEDGHEVSGFAQLGFVAGGDSVENATAIGFNS